MTPTPPAFVIEDPSVKSDQHLSFQSGETCPSSGIAKLHSSMKYDKACDLIDVLAYYCIEAGYGIYYMKLDYPPGLARGKTKEYRHLFGGGNCRYPDHEVCRSPEELEMTSRDEPLLGLFVH
ncbi:hypothetical protein AgCh_034150 [Apium graveolens]